MEFFLRVTYVGGIICPSDWDRVITYSPDLGSSLQLLNEALFKNTVRHKLCDYLLGQGNSCTK